MSRNNKHTFNPSTSIPSLAWKAILITGGTAGLGRETVLAFAAHEPARIFFTGRKKIAVDKLIRQIYMQQPTT